MDHCQKCTRKLRVGENFCSGCGYPVIPLPAQPLPPAMHPENLEPTRQTARTLPAGSAQKGPYTRPSDTPSGKPRRRWLWWGALLVCIGGGAGSYLYLPEYRCRQVEQSVLAAAKDGHLVRRQPTKSNEVKEGDNTAYDLFEKSKDILCEDAKMRIADALVPELINYGDLILGRPGKGKDVVAQEWLEAERIYKWLPQLRWREAEKTKGIWEVKRQFARGQYEAAKEQPDGKRAMELLNQATAKLEQLEKKDPKGKLAWAYFSRGLAAQSLGLEGSCKDFKSALDNENMLRACYLSIEMCKTLRSNCTDVLRAYLGQSQNQEDAQAHYNLARLYNYSDKCREAFLSYEKARKYWVSEKISGFKKEEAEKGMKMQCQKFTNGKCADELEIYSQPDAEKERLSKACKIEY